MGAERRRSRRQLTLVAAGHEGSVLKELSQEEPTGVILKVVDPTELEFYKVISKTNEGIKKFIPEYGGETTLDGEKFLRLQNVASPFRHPYVMDCKIGTRTFVEKEALVTKPRADLFKRAMQHYSSSLTEEEKAQEFITKYRWMSIHDENSTTKSLGFRIDGVAGKRKVEKTMLQKLRSREDIVNFFVTEFIPRVVEGSFRPESTRRQIGALLSRKIRELRRMFEESPTMQRHEVIGSSLLIVADCDGRCGMNMIDFAKTKPVPEDLNIDHRTQWQVGNHEDGILYGIDNLVNIFDEVLARTRFIPGENEAENNWIQSLFCAPFKKWGDGGEELIAFDENNGQDKIADEESMTETELNRTKPSRNTIGIPADGFNANKSTKITIIGKAKNTRQMPSKTLQKLREEVEEEHSAAHGDDSVNLGSRETQQELATGSKSYSASIQEIPE